VEVKLQGSEDEVEYVGIFLWVEKLLDFEKEVCSAHVQSHSKTLQQNIRWLFKMLHNCRGGGDVFRTA
jgi:hypothetical protein